MRVNTTLSQTVTSVGPATCVTDPAHLAGHSNWRASRPILRLTFTSYGTFAFFGERTGSFPFSFSLSLSLSCPVYVEGTSLTTSLRYQDLVRI